MSDLDNQLKKGTLSIIILKLISERDMYGYEIIQLLDEISEGYYKLKEGTLYPILYRLEDNGFIESYSVVPKEERKIPRKYYRITPIGVEAYREQIALWKYFYGTTNKVLSIE